METYLRKTADTLPQWLDVSEYEEVTASWKTIQELWRQYDHAIENLDGLIESLNRVAVKLDKDDWEVTLPLAFYTASLASESGKKVESLTINKGLCKRLMILLDFLLSIPYENDVAEWMERITTSKIKDL